MPIHGTRISRRVKEKFQKTIRNVVKGLSRKVLIYKQPIKNECPNCYFDKLTHSSTGKCRFSAAEVASKRQDWIDDGKNVLDFDALYKFFKHGRCPICHGKGFLEIQRRTWIDALVIWDPSGRSTNDLTFTPAGTEGSTIVMLKTEPKYYDLFKNSSKILVDGVECKMSKPPILRGLGSQAILIITAFTTEKPKIDNDEIIKDYL